MVRARKPESLSFPLSHGRDVSGPGRAPAGGEWRRPGRRLEMPPSNSTRIGEWRRAVGLQGERGAASCETTVRCGVVRCQCFEWFAAGA